MDYRDEREALRGRVESLEEQLAATKQQLAAAEGKPAAPDPPKPRSLRAALAALGCFSGLFVAFWPFVFMPIMVIALGPLIVPSMARLAAPIVCPSTYVRSTVNTWSTTDGQGEWSEHWELECVDASGKAHPAADVPTWATLFAITEAGLITSLGSLLGMIVLSERIRRRRAKS